MDNENRVSIECIEAFIQAIAYNGIRPEEEYIQNGCDYDAAEWQDVIALGSAGIMQRLWDTHTIRSQIK